MMKEPASYLFEVSVIVLSYNSDINKFYKTLNSIISQKGVTLEIIVCDDGSNIRQDKELHDFFANNGFTSYQIIMQDRNVGTVSNFYSGLENAKGKYSKVISPGDYLVNDNVLCEWVRFLECNAADWSFSDTYYYKNDNGNERFIRVRALPQSIRPYLKGKKKECMWNYWVMHDNANGASIIGTTQIQLALCRLIKDNSVRYCEDLIWFLAMFYGNVACYYPKAVVCYDYGTGISTSNSAIWRDRLQRDVSIVYQMILNEKNPSHFQQMIQKAISKKTKFEKFFIKGKIYHWLKWRFFPRLTNIPEEDIYK